MGLSYQRQAFIGPAKGMGLEAVPSTHEGVDGVDEFGRAVESWHSAGRGD